MKKNKIELGDGKFILNDKPFYIYSGEIHYFRVPKDKWADRLKKAKETGLNTISTYIPWSWHEHQQGKFDFNGKTLPQRDLLSFIKLVKKSGLFMTARIGPICNGELKGEGVPWWFLQNYQEARAKDRRGSNVLHEAMVSYMHPVFQSYASKWYDKVLPIIYRNLSQKGGPIIMLQLDNEIGMMNWIMDCPDYNEATTQAYRRYLQQLYGNNLALLNEKYYTNHTNFDELQQPKGNVDEEGVTRCWDWVHFYRDFYARYYHFLAQKIHAKKINIPLLANIPMFWDYNICGRGNQGLMTTMQFRDFIKYTPNVIFGGAYQMRNLNYENFHDVILMNEAVDMIGDSVAPKICVETQVGGMNDRPRIYPNDIDMLLRLSVGEGMNGLNAYMFCGGVNPPGLGSRGSYHEWQSPITITGKKTPRIKPLEDVAQLLKTFGGQIADTKKNYDMAMGFYAPYYETGFLKGSVAENMSVSRDKFFFDGVARLLALNGFSYRLVDIERAKEGELAHVPAMWLFCLDYMDKDTQVKLVEYVKKGGILIMSHTVPSKNMCLLREDTFLKEFEVNITETVNENLVYISGRDYLVDTNIKIFDSRKRRVLARTKDRRPCAIIKKIKKGKVVMLGFGVMHQFDYHVSLIMHFMRLVGIEPSVKVSCGDVHAVVRSNKKYGFLSLCNFNDEPRELTLSLRMPATGKLAKIPQDGALLLANRSACILPLNVPVSDRAKIVYSTAEVSKVQAGEKETRLSVCGSRGGRAEIVMEVRKPRSVMLDNSELPFKHKDGLLKVSFELTGGLQSVAIF